MNELKIQDLVLNVLTQEQFDSAEKDAAQLYLTPDTSIDSSEKGAAGGVATLDSNAKVPTDQIPALPYLPTSGGTVNGTILFGDRTGGIFPTINDDVSFINLGKDGNSGCFQGTKDGSIEIYAKGFFGKKLRGSSIDGRWTIGGNKILDASDKAVPNGVASLDRSGKVPAEQLPDALTNAVAKTGDTMTGALKVPTPASTTNDTTVPTTEWVRSYGVNKSGDTMTGALKAPTPGTDSNDTTVVTSAWVRNLLEQEKTKLMGIPNTKAGVDFTVRVTDNGSNDTVTTYTVPSNGVIFITSYSNTETQRGNLPEIAINGKFFGDVHTIGSHVYQVLAGDIIGCNNPGSTSDTMTVNGVFYPYL